jgi:hypothetical protein
MIYEFYDKLRRWHEKYMLLIDPKCVKVGKWWLFGMSMEWNHECWTKTMGSSPIGTKCETVGSSPIGTMKRWKRMKGKHDMMMICDMIYYSISCYTYQYAYESEWGIIYLYSDN